MREILLTQGKVALVDDSDYERVNKYKWCYSSGGYAKRIKHNTTILMHRFILGVTDSKVIVDHISRVKTDNRKENLRLCTNEENRRNQVLSIKNSTGFKGVYYDKCNKTYRAAICMNGKMKALGSFPSAFDAALAYDSEAIKLHGEFASTNLALGLLNK